MKLIHTQAVALLLVNHYRRRRSRRQTVDHRGTPLSIRTAHRCAISPLFQRFETF